MRQYSELYLLGYNTSEPEIFRRHILEKAVHELGLQTVVNSIYMNIKRGLTRAIPPERGIDIWISDVDWLRQNYISKNPEVWWPETYEGFD